MKEQYKIIPIPKLQPYYSISEYGTVVNNSTGFKRKPNTDKYGYLRISIFHYPYPIHYLVAITFLGERPPGFQINHIDGDKLNNHYSNLEYISQTDNMFHSFSMRGKFPERFTKIECWKDNNLIKIYNYLSEVKEDGFRISNVSDVLRGRGKTVKGHIFKGIKS